MKRISSVMIASLIFVFLGCEEKKKETWTPERGADVSSNEAPRWAVSQQQAQVAVAVPTQHCYAALPAGITLTQGQSMPDELEINCTTQDPLNAVNFRAYMSKLQQAIDAHNAKEQQQRMQAQAQAVQQQMPPQPQAQPNDRVMHGGVLEGMPIMDGQNADQLQRNWDAQRSAQEDNQQNRDMARLNTEAIYQCRKACAYDSNPSLCRLSCR